MRRIDREPEFDTSLFFTAGWTIDFGDERARLTGDKIQDFPMGGYHVFGEFVKGYFADFAGQYEQTHAGSKDGFLLIGFVTNSPIVGQHKPSAPADFRKPVGIRGVLSEMVIMTFDPNASFREHPREPFAEVPIGKENNFLKRHDARTGWQP